MAPVDAITGQALLIADILRVLRSTDRPAIRLRGPSGSGKSWVAQAVVQAWRGSGTKIDVHHDERDKTDACQPVKHSSDCG